MRYLATSAKHKSDYTASFYSRNTLESFTTSANAKISKIIEYNNLNSISSAIFTRSLVQKNQGCTKLPNK